jgi:uncharacterized protein
VSYVLDAVLDSKGKQMMIRLISANLLLISLLYAGCTRSPQPNKNVANANVSTALEARDEQGNTPLLQAVNSGDTVETRRLIEAGADVNAASNSGVTPLMNAAGMGNKEAVELLLQKGANVNYRTAGNYTALMNAALVGHVEVVKILLSAGADPTVKDAGGRTALTYAEEKDRKEIVELLKPKMGTQTNH